MRNNRVGARYKIVSPVRFFITILISVMLMIMGIYTVATHNSTEAATVNTYRQVTVDANDTLWSIASDYCDDSEDVRSYIDEICEINDISSDVTLQIGDTIFVPLNE